MRGKWNLDGKGHAVIPKEFAAFAARKKRQFYLDALRVCVAMFFTTMLLAAFTGEASVVLAKRIFLYQLGTLVCGAVVSFVAT